jgi:tetratricopeptide (TPR) repeat protein
MKFPVLCVLSSIFLAADPAGGAPLIGDPRITPRLAQLTEAVEKNPTNALALQDRGHAFALLGMKEAALADLQRAVVLAPGNDKVLNRVAWSYFNLEEYRRALDAWLESARLSGYERYYDYYTVALGYWGVGDRVKATAFYNTAVEQDETFGEWKTLVTRTETWTWAEKNAIYGIHDAWRLGYRRQEEKKP